MLSRTKMDEKEKIKKQLRICILISSVSFFLSVFSGYVTANLDFESAVNVVRQTTAQFSRIKDLDAFSVFLFIFFNNALKGFFAMLSGILFGVMPLIFLFSNGQLIGLILGIGEISNAILVILIGLAPHGVLEIPAIILATSYGFWLGYGFFRLVAFHEPFRKYLSYALERYMKIVVPLLFFAALIETFITPMIIKIFS